MRRMNLIALLAPVAGLFLSACVTVLPEAPPAPVIYTLRPGEIAPLATQPAPVSIVVAAASASRAVAGQDVVWRTGAEIAFMDRAQWNGAAPDLLRSLVIDAFSRQGLVKAAVPAGAGVRAQYELRWDIAEFGVADDGGALTARFAGGAMLVDTTTRQIVEIFRFAEEGPIDRRSGRVAAAALETVARRGAASLAQWAGERAAARAAGAPTG